MKNFFITVAMILFSFPVYADNGEKIKELVSLMNYDKLIEDTVNQQIFYPLNCLFVIPEAEKDSVKQQLTKTINLQKLADSTAHFLSENLNESELDDVLNFYRTPGGQKLIRLQSELSQFFANELTTWFNEIAPQMKDFTSQLEAKYAQRAGNDIQACLALKNK